MYMDTSDLICMFEAEELVVADDDEDRHCTT